MARRKTKLDVLDEPDDSLISEKISVYKLSNDELLEEEPEEIQTSNVEGILNQDPLYDETNNIEDMSKRNKDFYEKTSKKVFKTLLKEEQETLTGLVSATYYPEYKEEEPDNLTLVRDHLNLVQ
jgi:hypothetical protein